MTFLDKDLLAYFMNGRSDDRLYDLPAVPSELAGRGILAINGDNYEKIQVNTGKNVPNGFRVTTGWHEKGTFKSERKREGTLRERVIRERMCMIGPGYPEEHFDITPKTPSGLRYLVNSFEPNLFQNRKVQLSADWL